MHFDSFKAENIDPAGLEAALHLPSRRSSDKPISHEVCKVPGKQYYASGLSWVYGRLVDKDRRLDPLYEYLKRVFDMATAGAALFVLSPIYVLLAVAVLTTSRGPVFFVQRRPGKDGVMFPMLKFRSMQHGLGDSSGVAQTVKNDIRLTPIGQFIRKTSLDELPQLFNVLMGHMSLVGPRPHPLGMKAGGVDYKELVPYYELRHSVRPGLSGWAQVNGLRGPTTDQDLAVARIDHDLAYIQNRSFWLDIKIIIRTIWQQVLGGSGL